MNLKKTLALIIALATTLPVMAASGDYSLTSPNGEISVAVSVGEKITYSVSNKGTQLISPSPVSMTLTNGEIFGSSDKVKKATRTSVNDELVPVVYKKSLIKENYNELKLAFKEFSLIFRAYDEGVAYRFVANMKEDFCVKKEEATFNFPADYEAFIPYVREDEDAIRPIEQQYNSSFENVYVQTNVSRFDSRRLAFTPVTLRAGNGMSLCITESDLLNYPGMFLQNTDGSNSLSAHQALYPDKEVLGGHNLLQYNVMSHKDYIAEASATEAFPWRVMIIANEEKDLLGSDLVWLLARPSEGDYSWVTPGKVAWDWWNDWNLYDVDFRAGINNPTYEYYVDFAAAHGIGYVILDEGWAVNKKTDLFQIIPELDLPALCKYAESKGVGIVLWAGYAAFVKDLEKVCKVYSEMGVKGFKVDFMDRDDQKVIASYETIAKVATQCHLMIDFHGTSKPAGIQRTYPNIINFEGVYGLEQLKWGERDQVTYDVVIPFARNVAGPMDYTQGAMRNATKGNYRPVNSEAMSQGTRCRQLAEYVVFDSPFNMLCDSPSNYMNEKECTNFIASCPETWDETVPLAGKIGEYVAVARRKGDTWYVGAITSWDARDLTLDLSFLSAGPWNMEIFKDGINADRAARDYKRCWDVLKGDKKYTIHMAPGGGWAAIIKKMEVVGHRGYWDRVDPKTYEGDITKLAPENSMQAVKRGIDAGLYGCEIDIHLTTDGELIVHHNRTREGVDLQKSTYAQCRALHLPNGEPLPDFKEMLRYLKASPTRTKLLVEIKSHEGKEANYAVAEAAVKAVKEIGVQDKVVYMSFNMDVLDRCKQMDPDALLGYIESDIAPADLYRRGVMLLDYSARSLREHPQWLEQANKLDMMMVIWTLNSPEAVTEAMNAGVPVIETDFATMALDTVSGK